MITSPKMPLGVSAVALHQEACLVVRTWALHSCLRSTLRICLSSPLHLAPPQQLNQSCEPRLVLITVSLGSPFSISPPAVLSSYFGQILCCPLLPYSNTLAHLIIKFRLFSMACKALKAPRVDAPDRPKYLQVCLPPSVLVPSPG